jgi:hypothetical protein
MGFNSGLKGLNTRHHQRTAICFISHARHITVISLDQVKTLTFAVLKDPNPSRSSVSLIIHFIIHFHIRINEQLQPHCSSSDTATAHNEQQSAVNLHTTGLVPEFQRWFYEASWVLFEQKNKELRNKRHFVDTDTEIR